jgi:hypothetical protein
MPLSKPANATWVAKAVVDFDAETAELIHESAATGHQFGQLDIALYNDPPRLKFTIRGAGPAHIQQAYLPGAGRDVIVELVTP